MEDTKEKIQIIIVEDDNGQQDMYKDCINEFNLENKIHEVNAFQFPNDKDVPKILYNNHIDAIIIDLDWGTGSQQNEGNRLVQKIYKDCRVPIFIVSGNLSLLEQEYKESPILKKYERDNVDFSSLLKEIESLYETGYTKVMGSHSKIDEMLSKVFWEHMSNMIKYWEEQKETLHAQRMLRFAVTRINEMLTIDIDDNHDSYDALEFYIKPAIKTTPFTGDIISFEDKKYIVITAACDMEQDKSDFVVLCQIDFTIIDGLKNSIKGGKKNAEKKLGEYINNKKARFHLLPPCKLFSGGLVDFQIIRSVKKEDFQEHSSVIASINPAFNKDIQARFSHYYGRQGQPQLNKDNIISWIKKN